MATSLPLSAKIRATALIFSLVLFGISCSLPALEFITDEKLRTPVDGGLALMVGWLGLVSGQVGWLANIALLFGMLFLWRYRIGATVLCALLALGLAAHTFALFNQSLPEYDQAANMMQLYQLKSGFYVWAGSMISLLIGAIATHTVGRMRL